MLCHLTTGISSVEVTCAATVFFGRRNGSLHEFSLICVFHFVHMLWKSRRLETNACFHIGYRSSCILLCEWNDDERSYATQVVGKSNIDVLMSIISDAFSATHHGQWHYVVHHGMRCLLWKMIAEEHECTVERIEICLWYQQCLECQRGPP